jgi:predicted molibdopterin-dependent oxidoreductase YjgC
MLKTLSVCPYCGCGCNFYLVSDGTRVTGVEPCPDNPVNKGMLCAKGWNGYDFVNDPVRLKQPLIRVDGELKEASWDEALSLVAKRLLDISVNSGPDTIGFLCSAKVTNEENYLLMKLARAVFKTNNVDHCARL